MTECRQIESLLPPYVDGESPAEATAVVNAHLAVCPACRQLVDAQRTIRTVLRARAAHLGAPAPPGLRTRIAAWLMPDAWPRLPWRWRLSAIAAAATLVLGIGIGFEFLPLRSSALVAAQLAIDHVRCFLVEFTSTRPADAGAAERRYAERYGWRIPVPPSNEAVGLTFVAARRCPFWLGDHAHLLYRRGAREVSLYVTPAVSRPPADVAVLGHAERIWSTRDASYALVARGFADAELAAIVKYFEHAAGTGR